MVTAATPGQAAWEAFAAFRRADLGGEFYAPAKWGDDYDDARKWEAAWEAAAKAGHAAIAAQPAPGRTDEFARVKVKLCALIASMEDTVRPRPGDLYDSMSREFDDGAVHATAVTLRQLRAILDETALSAGEPQPAPGDGELIETIAAWLYEEFSDYDDWGHAPQRKREYYLDRARELAAALPDRPEPAPELAAAMAESRALRNIIGTLIDLFDEPDLRNIRHARVTKSTLTRYAAEAGVRP